MSRNTDILLERDLIGTYLNRFDAKQRPVMIQIGANEGKYEYAKHGGEDFVFEFLLENPHWSAVLVEPVPESFELLKRNYHAHRNSLSFLNCAVTEELGERSLHIAGRDGKRSSLLPVQGRKVKRTIPVQCLSYKFICRILGISKVDFVKIDAEGYDHLLLMSILELGETSLRPQVLLWESHGPAEQRRQCEALLCEVGYKIFRTGLTSQNVCMDRVAIHPSLL